MKISLKHQAIEKKNSAACSVIEHNLNDEKLDIAIAKILGRYPDARRVVNQKCCELAYVSQGEGKVVIENEEYKISAGDVVLIEAGEKYYWEGSLQLIMTCRPAWTSDQHQLID